LSLALLASKTTQLLFGERLLHNLPVCPRDTGFVIDPVGISDHGFAGNELTLSLAETMPGINAGQGKFRGSLECIQRLPSVCGEVIGGRSHPS
jgi:hypothetical protein